MNSSAEQLIIEEQDRDSLTPPLKWAGGKRWLMPRLIQLYQPHRSRRLVEPFVGGMAVALGLKPEHALLNDVNPHLINFYRHLQKGLRRSIEMRNERTFFFNQRERFNFLIRNNKNDSKEAAELFYYMNRTAFNGLCRFNSKGEYNVPFGKYAKINYKDDFSNYTELLSRWNFSCDDFKNLAINTDDFLYVDPPYDVEFTRYAQDDFTWKDQERLVEWLANFSCPIVISNQATKRIIDLYQSAGYTIEEISAPRRISCTGNRDRALEVLAIKNLDS